MNNTDQMLPIIRSFQVAPENQEKNNALVRVDKCISMFRIGKHSQSDTSNRELEREKAQTCLSCSHQSGT